MLDKFFKVKYIFIIIFILIILLILTYLIFFNSKNTISKNNLKVIANYDNGFVTSDEFEIYYKLFNDMLRAYDYMESEIQTEVAKKLTTDKIVFEEAKKKGITLSNSEIDNIDKSIQENLNSIKGKGISFEEIKEVYYNDGIIQSYLKTISENQDEIDEKVSELISSKHLVLNDDIIYDTVTKIMTGE